MPTQNVNLSEQQVGFIRQNIEQGRYRNVSEVVRAGLRMLEQTEKQDKLKLAALRRMAREAFGEIERGEYELVNPDGLETFMAKMDAKVRGSKPR